jgi:hypothetical protein
MLARQRHLRCFSEKQVKKQEGEKSIVVARQGPRRRTSAQVQVGQNQERMKKSRKSKTCVSQPSTLKVGTKSKRWRIRVVFLIMLLHRQVKNMLFIR